MKINLQPIAIVKNLRTVPTDDHWESIISEIELSDHIPNEAFDGILAFSHLEIIFCFHKVKSEDLVFSQSPRGNSNYPRVGIFAQRKKDRPNKIGLATVELLSQNERSLTVKYLDAIDGTPVLDIKPVFKEFRPKSDIKQPHWVDDLMKNYWE